MCSSSFFHPLSSLPPPTPEVDSWVVHLFLLACSYIRKVPAFFFFFTLSAFGMFGFVWFILCKKFVAGWTLNHPGEVSVLFGFAVVTSISWNWKRRDFGVYGEFWGLGEVKKMAVVRKVYCSVKRFRVRVFYFHAFRYA